MEEIKRKLQIGVMGPAESEYPKNANLKYKICEIAEKLGELLAEKGAIVFTRRDGWRYGACQQRCKK